MLIASSVLAKLHFVFASLQGEAMALEGERAMCY